MTSINESIASSADLRRSKHDKIRRFCVYIQPISGFTASEKFACEC